jgi:multidrug efflux pump subunit AcrA (membrane-fusion protein)
LAYSLSDCIRSINGAGAQIKRDLNPVALLAVTVLLAGCAPQQPAATMMPTDRSVLDRPTFTVQRGDVVEAISFAGRVLPLIQEYLVVPTSGRVGTLYVHPGDSVLAGQILADIEGIDALQQQKALADLHLQRALTQAEIADLDLNLFKQQTPTTDVGYQEQLAIKERQVVLAQLEIAEAQIEADELEKRIEESLITSSMDGQLRFLDIESGDDIEARDQVGIVADISQLEIGAELPNETLSLLTEGMSVSLTPAHDPASTLFGLIRQLPAPYGSNGVVSGNSPADAFAWISLDIDLAQADLQLDDLVTITVVLNQSKNTLWLVPEAVRTFEGQTFVIIQENGLQRHLDVKIGLRNNEQVEIVEGLTEGQIVLGQ